MHATTASAHSHHMHHSKGRGKSLSRGCGTEADPLPRHDNDHNHYPQQVTTPTSPTFHSHPIPAKRASSKMGFSYLNFRVRVDGLFLTRFLSERWERKRIRQSTKPVHEHAPHGTRQRPLQFWKGPEQAEDQIGSPVRPGAFSVAQSTEPLGQVLIQFGHRKVPDPVSEEDLKKEPHLRKVHGQSRVVIH